MDILCFLYFLCVIFLQGKTSSSTPDPNSIFISSQTAQGSFSTYSQSNQEATDISTETTDTSIETTDASTETTDTSTETTDISTETTDTSLDTTDKSTEATDTSTETTYTITKNTDAFTGTTNLSNATSEISIKTTEISPETIGTYSSTESTETSTETTEISTEYINDILGSTDNTLVSSDISISKVVTTATLKGSTNTTTLKRSTNTTKASTEESSNSNNTGMIVGGVLGGTIGMFVIIVAVCMLLRKCSKDRNSTIEGINFRSQTSGTGSGYGIEMQPDRIELPPDLQARDSRFTDVINFFRRSTISVHSTKSTNSKKSVKSAKSEKSIKSGKSVKTRKREDSGSSNYLHRPSRLLSLMYKKVGRDNSGNRASTMNSKTTNSTDKSNDLSEIISVENKGSISKRGAHEMTSVQEDDICTA